jgi:hypothetical protein
LLFTDWGPAAAVALTSATIFGYSAIGLLPTTLVPLTTQYAAFVLFIMARALFFSTCAYYVNVVFGQRNVGHFFGLAMTVGSASAFVTFICVLFRVAPEVVRVLL